MVTLKIPIEIVSEANSNDHWRAKHKRVKIQKFIVKSFLNTIEIPSLPMTITMTRWAPRPFDDDNIRIAFKYIRDALSEYILGLADNKIYRAGRADNDPRIKWDYAQEKTTQEEYYITISFCQIRQTDPQHMQNPNSLSENQYPTVDQ